MLLQQHQQLPNVDSAASTTSQCSSSSTNNFPMLLQSTNNFPMLLQVHCDSFPSKQLQGKTEFLSSPQKHNHWFSSLGRRKLLP
ncbi:hypothetical protein Bpfe_023955 [Biomphalaria pfeifferi]|uniref:Uncharacterized protein n=1 Tax=Biomphalaria pfeifferi TaxID=112525 RepID=A0AAD8B4P1_BIOPF|nr:hypothetical protein Bpfe_023955 [Biomphalaria pfeifferi]